jgi:hypothetical protein
LSYYQGKVALTQYQGRDSGSLEGMSALLRLGESKPFVVLGQAYTSLTVELTRDNNLVTWGNGDGTVSVFDLRQIREHLDQVGLGWEP